MDGDVTIIGNILPSSGSGQTVIDVMPELGDAKKLGLAGQVTVLDRQILATNRGGRFDVIRIPAHVAAAILAPHKTPAPAPRKRKGL